MARSPTKTVIMLVAWSMVITLLALFANRPVHLGALSGNSVEMGFPFQIAKWVDGELHQFYSLNLLVNVALWFSAALCVPYLVWLDLSVRNKWFEKKDE
ncbi:hypothetical protein [Bremerella sp.]|uniref:hypothetical protein n=1 Tax=Bremerella sp. TaxID=2795602 RepID=UPI00391CE82F